MKQLLTGCMLAAVLVLYARGAAGAGHRLAVAIEPRFAGAPLAFDAMTNLAAQGQRVSVTRLANNEGTVRLEMAPEATPYRFSISRFFPRPALPIDNPLTEEGVHLGSLLFFDPRLSVNNSQSCASCHQSEAVFTDRGRAVSRGAEGHLGTRNSMPLFNLAWKSSFFWDGRAASLREQVLQPIQNPIEMHETLENVVTKLKSSRVNSRHQTRALQSHIGNPPSELAQSLQEVGCCEKEARLPFSFCRCVRDARHHGRPCCPRARAIPPHTGLS